MNTNENNEECEDEVNADVEAATFAILQLEKMKLLIQMAEEKKDDNGRS